MRLDLYTDDAARQAYRPFADCRRCFTRTTPCSTWVLSLDEQEAVLADGLSDAEVWELAAPILLARVQRGDFN